MIYIPYIMELGEPEILSTAELYLATKSKSSQDYFENYKNLPKFISFARKNGKNIFQINSQQKQDIGIYKIRVLTQVYNPFKKSFFINDQFSWILQVLPPKLNIKNTAPVFQIQPLPANLELIINIVSDKGGEQPEAEDQVYYFPIIVDTQDVSFLVQVDQKPFKGIKATTEMTAEVLGSSQIKFRGLLEMKKSEFPQGSIITAKKAIKELNLQPSYTLDVSLSDGKLSSDYQLKVNILVSQVLVDGKDLSSQTDNQSNFQFEWDWEKNQKKAEVQEKKGLKNLKPQVLIKKQVRPPPKIEIADIDSLGQIILSFSEEMKISSYGIEKLQKLVNTIFVVTVQKQDLDDETNLNKRRILKATESAQGSKAISAIFVEEIQAKQMILVLNFESPFFISPAGGNEIDILNLKIQDQSQEYKNLFASQDSGLMLHQDNLEMSFPLPSQIPLADKDTIQSGGQIAEGGMNSLMLGNMILQLLMSSSLKKLLKVISQLQIIVFMVLINFNFPGNMQFILQQMNGLANLKVIPQEWIQDMVRRFTPGQQVQDQNLSLNGYRSSNLLINLGGFLPIIVVSLVGLIFLAIFGCLIKRIQAIQSPQVKKILTKIQHKVFWGSIIQIMIHSYTQTSISTFISIKQQVSWASIFIIVFYLLGFPGFIFFYLSLNRKRITEVISKKRRKRNFEEWVRFNQQEIKLNAFKPLWDGLRASNKMALAYYIYFLFRRLTYVAILIYVSQPSLQIILKIIQTLISLTYVLKYRPHDQNFQNKIEIWNECVLLGLDYHLVTILNNSDDPILVYQIGWSFICVFLLMIFNTISLMTYDGISNLIHKKQMVKLLHKRKQRISKQDSNQEALIKIQANFKNLVGQRRLFNSMVKNRIILQRQKAHWEYKNLKEKNTIKYGIRLGVFQSQEQYFKIKQIITKAKLPIVIEDLELEKEHENIEKDEIKKKQKVQDIINKSKFRRGSMYLMKAPQLVEKLEVKKETSIQLSGFNQSFRQSINRHSFSVINHISPIKKQLLKDEELTDDENEIPLDSAPVIQQKRISSIFKKNLKKLRIQRQSSAPAHEEEVKLKINQFKTKVELQKQFKKSQSMVVSKSKISFQDIKNQGKNDFQL